MLASDISDSDIPHQYRSLWQSCKTKARYILESLKGDMVKLPQNIKTKLTELVSEIRSIAKNSGAKVMADLERIGVDIETSYTPSETIPTEPVEVPTVSSRPHHPNPLDANYGIQYKSFIDTESLANGGQIEKRWLGDHYSLSRHTDSNGAITGYTYEFEYNGKTISITADKDGKLNRINSSFNEPQFSDETRHNVFDYICDAYYRSQHLADLPDEESFIQMCLDEVIDLASGKKKTPTLLMSEGDVIEKYMHIKGGSTILESLVKLAENIHQQRIQEYSNEKYTHMSLIGEKNGTPSEEVFIAKFKEQIETAKTLEELLELEQDIYLYKQAISANKAEYSDLEALLHNKKVEIGNNPDVQASKISPQEKLKIKNKILEICAKYEKYPVFATHVPDDFWEKFDYEHADRHIKHIEQIVKYDYDNGYQSVCKNGYFYSLEGAEVFDELANMFPIKAREGSVRTAFDLHSSALSVEEFNIAKARGLFDDPKYEKLTSFSIKEVVQLSDEQFNNPLLQTFMERGCIYISENAEINRLIDYATQKGLVSSYELSQLEKYILEISENNPDRIKYFVDKLCTLQSKDAIAEFYKYSSPEGGVIMVDPSENYTRNTLSYDNYFKYADSCVSDKYSGFGKNIGIISKLEEYQTLQRINGNTDYSWEQTYETQIARLRSIIEQSPERYVNDDSLWYVDEVAQAIRTCIKNGKINSDLLSKDKMLLRLKSLEEYDEDNLNSYIEVLDKFYENDIASIVSNNDVEGLEAIINGIRTSEVKQIAENFFHENAIQLALVSNIMDKETIDVLMRKRFDDAEEYLDSLTWFSSEDLNLYKSLCESLNVDGKPFLPTQKLEFIDLISAYENCNLSKAKMNQMIAENKVDLGELNRDLFNSVMQKCGLSDAEIAQIPLETLMKWDVKYVHLLIKEIQNNENNVKEVLQDMIRAVNAGKFEEFIADTSNKYGRTNAQTKAMFGKTNMNYDSWVKPPKEAEVKCVLKDQNLHALETKAGDIEEYINKLPQAVLKGFIKKQYPNFIQMVKDDAGNEVAKFVIPSDIKSSKAKLIELVQQLSDTSDKGQIAQVWNRAKGNLENADPKRVENARNTLTILDHLQEDLKAISEISEVKSSKTLNVTIKMWDRNPQKDIYQGNYSTCCIGMGNGNGSAMPHYIMDTAYNMIEIVDNVSGRPIGNALCYFAIVDGKRALIIDNIEINNGQKPSAEIGRTLRDKIAEYAANVAKAVTGREDTPIFMGDNYNDVPTNDLKAETHKFQFIGKVDSDNIYMDLYNGWTSTSNLTAKGKMLRLNATPSMKDVPAPSSETPATPASPKISVEQEDINYDNVRQDFVLGFGLSRTEEHFLNMVQEAQNVDECKYIISMIENADNSFIQRLQNPDKIIQSASEKMASLENPETKTQQMTTVVTPQKLIVASNSPVIFDKYKALSEAVDNPIYDFDNARFKDSANARVLEKVTPPQNEEVIEVSNYEKINGKYPGTIAATTTLDKCIYTDRMVQCASLVVVDRAHNTQSLIHCFPGDQTDCAKAVIEHILSGSNPEDLELSIVNGSEYATITTVQFLLDTVNDLAKGAKVELCNFPNWKELGISDRALLLKDGKLTCCDAREVTNKNTNPTENITYYERGEYLPQEGVRDYIVKLVKAAKTPEAVADLIDELQTKEEAIYLSYHIHNIAADNNFDTGPKEGLIRLIENKVRTLPEYNSQPETPAQNLTPTQQRYSQMDKEQLIAEYRKLALELNAGDLSALQKIGTLSEYLVKAGVDVHEALQDLTADKTPNKPLTKEEVDSKLSEILDDYEHEYNEVIKNFDYENANRHLQHLTMLTEHDSNRIYGASKNGYFSSKEGAEMFDELAKRFSAERTPGRISLLDQAMDALSVEDAQKLLRLGVLDNPNISPYRMGEIAELSEEEIVRLKQTSVYRAGLSYASDNDAINDVFIILNDVSRRGYTAHTLREIEAEIKSAANNSPEEIAKICDKIQCLDDKLDIFEKMFDYRHKDGDFDLQCFVDNIESIYELLHKRGTKLNDFMDDAFDGDIVDVMKAINKDNVHLVEKLVNVDGIDQMTLWHSLEFASTPERVHHVETIIDKIHSGEETAKALPYVKYSEPNPNVVQQKYAALPKYPVNEPLSELVGKTSQGQVVAVGNDTYINHNGNMVKLNMSAAMYEKLFPAYETACIQQGHDTGDCYFLSGVLYSFMQNSNAKIVLLQCIQQVGNDIVVTIPGYKDYPVTFKNGEIELGENHATTSLGNLMLEQTYAKARYASSNGIADANSVSADEAMKHIEGGIMSNTYDEFFPADSKQSISYTIGLNPARDEVPRNYENIEKEQMATVLDKYAGRTDVILSAGSGSRDAGYLPDYGVVPNHAYAIESIDKAARTVTIINPGNTLYRMTLSYDQFTEFFNILSVKELDTTPVSPSGKPQTKQPVIENISAAQNTTIEQNMTALSEMTLTPDALPQAYKDMWNSCQVKAKYIIESLGGNELTNSISAKCNELVADLETLAGVAKEDVAAQLSEIITSLKAGIQAAQPIIQPEAQPVVEEPKPTQLTTEENVTPAEEKYPVGELKENTPATEQEVRNILTEIGLSETRINEIVTPDKMPVLSQIAKPFYTIYKEVLSDNFKKIFGSDMITGVLEDILGNDRGLPTDSLFQNLIKYTNEENLKYLDLKFDNEYDEVTLEACKELLEDPKLPMLMEKLPMVYELFGKVGIFDVVDVLKKNTLDYITEENLLYIKEFNSKVPTDFRLGIADCKNINTYADDVIQDYIQTANEFARVCNGVSIELPATKDLAQITAQLKTVIRMVETYHIDLTCTSTTSLKLSQLADLANNPKLPQVVEIFKTVNPEVKRQIINDLVTGEISDINEIIAQIYEFKHSQFDIKQTSDLISRNSSLIDEGSVTTTKLKFMEIVNKNIKDYTFQLRLDDCKKLSDETELTETLANRYIAAINKFKSYDSVDRYSYRLYSYDKNYLDSGIKGFIENLEKLNTLLEQGLNLKTAGNNCQINFDDLMALILKTTPENVIKFINKIKPEAKDIAIEMANGGKITIDEKGAEFINALYDKYEHNKYKIRDVLECAQPNSQGVIDYDGVLELLNLIQPDANISLRRQCLNVHNGDYKGAKDFYNLVKDFSTEIYENAVKLEQTSFDEMIQAFNFVNENKVFEEKVRTKALESLFSVEHSMNVVQKLMNLRDNVYPNETLEELLNDYRYNYRYEMRQYADNTSVDDFIAKINFIKDEPELNYTFSGPKINAQMQVAMTDLPIEEFKALYNDLKAKYPEKYLTVMDYIANFNKDFALKIINKEGDINEHVIKMIAGVTPENISIVDELYSEHGMSLEELNKCKTYINKSNIQYIRELIADNEIPKETIVVVMPSINKNNAEGIKKLAKIKTLPAQYIYDIARQITTQNEASLLMLCNDPEFPKDKIADIASSLYNERIPLFKFLYEQKINPDCMSSILNNYSGNLEEVQQIITSGEFDSHKFLADYNTKYWRGIIDKGMTPDAIPEKLRQMLPAYAQARDPHIIENHQQLYEDAYNNRTLLKTGQDDLTDKDLDEVFLDLETVAALDIMGIGYLEAAFPLMIDVFEDLCEDIAKIKLSDENRKLLEETLTPAHSEEYIAMEKQLNALKKQMNELLGTEALNKIRELQKQKADIEEQIKQLNSKIALLDKDNPAIAGIRQQIRELQKQSKTLNGQAQSLYHTSPNAAQIKEYMNQISTLAKQMKNYIKEHSGLEPQDVVLKMRVIASLSNNNMVNDSEMTEFINLLRNPTPENQKIWDDKVNTKIYERIGVEYDEILAKKLDLLSCKYLSQMFVSCDNFFDNMKILVKHIKANPDKTVVEALDELPFNIETKRQLEALGIDYDKFTKVDKNSYTEVEVELNADEEKQNAIHNLEKDFNEEPFQNLPEEIRNGIIKRLNDIGVTLEKKYEEIFVGDGEANGTRDYLRLYRNGEPIKFEDMEKIMSVIKKEISSKQFWTVRNSDSTVEAARQHVYNHLIKLRTADVQSAKAVKDGEVAHIEVRKTDMYDIKKAIGLGNDGACCTGLGKNFNEWSAPTYIMSKCIGAIEVVDGSTFCGNSMIYIAYVDGKPALVMDNIELKPKYAYKDKIRDAFMEYAKKLCEEMGVPDLPIYAGPHRHKMNMTIYPKDTHTMQVVGNSGEHKVYLDYDIAGHRIDGTETAKIEMYRIR
ncbi:hypothetical protein IKP85_07375 [bacterium]|nr:hypothetical protein [bacterium]